MRVRITFELDDDDRAGIAHFVGNHKSGLRNHHQLATRDEARRHIIATIYGDLDELNSWAQQCDDADASERAS